MSRILFDTTFLIDIERGDADLDVALEDDDDVAVAAVTIAELRVGALLAKGRRRTRRLAFVDDVVETIPIVDYGLAVATAHADLLVAVRAQGRPRGAHDLIIAATASASNRVVLSADVSAFSDLPGITSRSHRES